MCRKLAVYILMAIACCFAVFANGETKATGDANMILLGDSNTWIGGDLCDNPKGWNYWLRETLQPAFCRSYARSGATWTNTARTRRNPDENIAVIGPDNVVYNQVVRLKSDADSCRVPVPDLIVVMCGTNDAWFSRRRPGIWADDASQVNLSTITSALPSGATSLARSVMLSCRMLQEGFPGTSLILVTPMPPTATSPANIARVADLIARCGKRLGVPGVRLDLESGIDPAEEKVKPRFTTDGTHTSAEGARRVAEIISKTVIETLSEKK